MDDFYQKKYLKYKSKYLKLKQEGGLFSDVKILKPDELTMKFDIYDEVNNVKVKLEITFPDTNPKIYSVDCGDINLALNETNYEKCSNVMRPNEDNLIYKTNSQQGRQLYAKLNVKIKTEITESNWILENKVLSTKNNTISLLMKLGKNKFLFERNDSDRNKFQKHSYNVSEGNIANVIREALKMQKKKDITSPR